MRRHCWTHWATRLREATSTHHEWLEDELLPNKDAVNDSTFTDPDVDTQFVVDNGSRFRVGDQIQIEGKPRADAGDRSERQHADGDSRVRGDDG